MAGRVLEGWATLEFICRREELAWLPATGLGVGVVGDVVRDGGMESDIRKLWPRDEAPKLNAAFAVRPGTASVDWPASLSGLACPMTSTI